MADKKKTGTEEEFTDPNKSSMLEPGDGDAATQIEDLTKDLLPTKPADDDSVELETTDTDTETDDKSDTDTETVDDDENPDLALLREHELDGLYSTIPAALAGAKEKGRTIETQRVQMQTMTNTLDRLAQARPAQPAVPAAVDQEALMSLLETNPQAAMAQMGFVHRDQIAPLIERSNTQQNQLDQGQDNLDRQAFAGALGQYDELKDVAAHFRSNNVAPAAGKNKVWDAMLQMYNSSPTLQAGGGWPSDAIPLLYDAAKQRLVTSPAVEKIPDKVKRGASTTSGGRGKPRDTGLPDWNRMTEDEQLQWFKDNDRYDA